MLHLRGPVDQRIALIASMQRGRIARRQLLAAGTTDRMIGTRVKRGILHRIADGVFAVGHGGDVELGREATALLAAGPEAMLSHGSAVRLWGMLWRPPPAHPVHVTLPASGGSRRCGVCVHRSGTLLVQDRRTRSGLPVTSPARTLLDFAAAGASQRDLELAYDEALRQELVRGSHVRAVLERAGRRPGAPALRALLERDTGETVTRSEAEEMLLALIRQTDLPAPALNVSLHGFLVDALWADARVVVEVDGHRYHGSRSAFESDRAKGAALSAAGFTVIRVTVRQLREAPTAFIARLASALTWGQARKAG